MGTDCGRLYALDLDTGAEILIDTGECDNCNNDHVVSPDEREIAVSHSDRSEPWASRVYVLPIGGQGSVNVNSWAADSRHLAFVSYELLHK